MKKILIIGAFIVGCMAGHIVNAGPAFDKALTKESPTVDKNAIRNEVKGTIDRKKIEADALEMVKPKGTFEFKSTFKKRLDALVDLLFNDELDKVAESTYKERLAKLEDYVGRLQILAIWFNAKFNLYKAQLNMKIFMDDKQFGQRFHNFLDPLSYLTYMIEHVMELKYPLALNAIKELDEELPISPYDEPSEKQKSFDKLKSYYSKLYEKIQPLEDKEKIWAEDPRFITLE
jgi:hypothetical protein